ncbi:NAD-dependent succinate-semialdehyde dehydrogenase [Aeromicrobium sp. 179-A 4D2 NHS]|uniref:NAD-dependent succinate-semialdehyde dehydrogenase n=1 Tax=Aeromicrobium sp. 179-A 4D2 NHS TaxID=3142375 RepID=UPI00399FC2F2
MSVDAFIEDLLAGKPGDAYIYGAWTEAADGKRFTVFDPATGEAITSVADSSAAEGSAALAAADAAQEAWSQVPPRERSRLLMAAYDAVVANTEAFARLITAEMGKSLAEARGEVAYGGEFLRWFAEEAVRIDGRFGTLPNGRLRMMVDRRPVGPSLLITPWNFPLAMATRKIGPALAAGCTAVVKPAELTPLTTLALAKVLEEVGLPAGVVNVVTTTDPGGATGHLLSDPRLRKLSFTGSTPVGKMLLAQAAEGVLRCSMELGGSAPFVVFEDADLDAAVEGAIAAKTRNIGEACTAANRFLVHESVREEFVARFGVAMGALRVGAGTQEGTDLGPLIDERSRERVHSLVEDAVERGARVVVGGELPSGPGHFYPATVIDGVLPGSRVVTEEIFGPVAPVQTFTTEDEAVALANETPYGLVGYVYTRDLDRTMRFVPRLQFGMVGVNTGVVSDPGAPFGGVKESGLGREGGREGIDEYLEYQYVGLAH